MSRCRFSPRPGGAWFAVLLLLTLVPPDEASAWWNGSWTRRRKITFNNSAQSENLDNFPVLIALNNTRIDYSRTQNAGQDLRFVDGDDMTPLDHEIELWNEAGTSYVWVRAPRIDASSSTDFIYMYYGNPLAPDAQNPTGVWDSGYSMVHHLEETAGAHVDSTSNPNDSIVVDVAAQGSAAGRINGADSFSTAGCVPSPATCDNIDIVDNATLDVGAAESMTVEAWIRTPTAGAFQHIAAKEAPGGVGTGFDLMVWTSNQARFTVANSGLAPTFVEALGGMVADNAWHYVVGRWTRSTSTADVFVDGAVVGTATNAVYAASTMSNTQPFRIGERGDFNAGGFNFNGTIDEVRFSKAAAPRSNAWIAAQYLSMTDAFASFGAEVDLASLGSMRVKSGVYIGSGLDDRPILVGFQPDVVLVKRDAACGACGNPQDYMAVVRTSTMTGDATKSLDNLLGLAVFAGGVKSLTATGFTVGTHPRVNNPGATYHWVAFAAAPDQLKVGTYTGAPPADDRSVTGVGFQPEFVIVLPAAGGLPGGVPYFRSSTMPADLAFDLDANGLADRIQAMEPDGFEIGSVLNQSAASYHYIAFNQAAGRVAVGSYAGTSVDPTNYDVVGFQPEWLLIKQEASVRPWHHKPASTGFSTDYSLLFSEFAGSAGRITALRPLGFQVTAHEAVNQAGNTYHWVAFGPYEAPINYRSIGTAPNDTTGTLTATNGSANVTGTGTSWDGNNRGRGDVITICDDPPGCSSNTNYVVASVGSGTSLQLTTAYAGPSGAGKTFTVRRQFSTFAAWEDCVDGPPGVACSFFPVASASLVADDRSEVGIAYEDTPFVLTGDVLIQGSTTDATHTIHLTADQGNRHNGVPGAGVVVNANGPNELSVRDSNVTVEWLEFLGCRGAINVAAVEVQASGGDLATNVLLQNLLIHDFDDLAVGNDGSGIALSGDLVGGSFKSVTIRNTIIWDGDNYGIEGDNSADTAIIENVSIDGMLNLGIWAGNSGFTIRNTIVTSSPTADFARDTSGSLAGSHNTDSDGSGAVFFTNSLTAAAPTIFSVPNSDLHLIGGANSQVDSGLDLSSSFVNDIDGQSRFRLIWDRGADERDAPATADLAITKDDGQASAVPGDPVSYTITVTNNGPDTLSSLTVNDPVPAEILSPVFTPSTGAYNPVTGLWTGLNLAATGSVTLMLAGTIDPFARVSLVNTATVSPPPGVTDPNGLDDFASDTDTLDASADVGIMKVDDVDPAPLGGLLTYTLTVTNNGPSGATNVAVSDPLPPNMSLDTAPGAITPSQGTCNYDAPTRTVDCALGSIGPTLFATVTIKLRPGATGLFTNTATTIRTEMDSMPGNNSVNETTTVEVSSFGVLVLTATSTNERNVLEWINPTDVEYDRTEIVWRTDRFPINPLDGTSIYNSGVGGSGGRVKLPHATGALSNGQTFYYGAFVHRLSAPLVSPGRFCTGRPFDHTPGPVKWAFATGATALAPPTVGGAGVIATSNDTNLYAMERGVDDDQVGVDSGEWPASFEPIDVGGPVQLRSPVVPISVGGANPVVFVGSQDGNVYAIDATQGGVAPYLWVAPLPPMLQAAPAGIFSAFFGSLDYVLVGTRDSALSAPNVFVALDPDTGVEIDRYNNGGPGAGAIGIVNGMAAVDYGPPARVYFTSYERTGVGSTTTLWCFELQATPPVFTLLWERALGNIDGSPVLRGGRVYVGSPAGGGTVYSIDAATGNFLLDRSFVHGNGQVKGFVFPDRASNDIYFATDDFVWGVTDTLTMPNKFAGPISLGGGAKPSAALFVPGNHYVYVGGSDGKLHEIDVLPAVPVLKQVTLGNGLAVVGAPSLDRVYGLIHVGSEAGIFYAVQIPLP